MIIKPFNLPHLGLLFIAILFIVISSLIFKNKSEKQKKIFLITLCVINIIAFFVYKAFLSVDKEFLVLSNIDKFNWFNELPLHLCNINMFLIPLGLILKKRSILGFSFFIAPLGALMALVFPETAFTGFSLAVPRMAGFYLTHLLIIVCGVLIASLGFYKPNPKDFWRIMVTFLILGFLAHIINTVFRFTVCPESNYFFTYGADISVLNLFWKIIPLPFLYELPALLILFAYMCIITFLFYIFGKKKKPNEPEQTKETAAVQ